MPVAPRLCLSAAAAVVLIAGAGLTLCELPTANAAVGASVTPASEEADCPPTWVWPPLHNDSPQYTDNGIAVYAGGDFSVGRSAAEAEGRVLVQGAMTFDRQPPGLFNLGRVGVGSQVAPTSGSVMVLTGASLEDDLTLTPGNRIEIGHGVAGGGDVWIGGDLVPSLEPVETNGGTVTSRLGAAATSGYSALPGELRELSVELAAQAPNGRVTVSGNRLTFTGTGEPGVLQVFTIDAAVLGQATIEESWVGIPEETAVVVNVTGERARMNPVFVSDDGVRADDPSSQRFPRVAVRTLWNFVDARSLDLAGTSQILGSILAMDAERTEITASTNGRLYLGGDLVLAGTGNETHNYHWPWSRVTSCEDEPEEEDPAGKVSVTKHLASDAALLPAGLSFEGAVSCATPSGQVTAGRWRIRPGQTMTQDGLPVGSVCEITEFTPQPVDGVQWDPPVFDPPDARVVVPPEGQPQVGVHVTNTSRARFAVTKQVIGPDGDDTGLAATQRTFAVEYACTSAGRPVDGLGPDGDVLPGSASGTLEIRAGQRVESPSFPVGTVCDLVERLTSEPGDFDDGHHWSAVEILPASRIVVGKAELAEIAVRNHFVREPEPLGVFAVTKSVQGPGGFIATDRTFPVDYVCTLDGAPSLGLDAQDGVTIVAPDGRGRLEVRAGERQTSPAFAVGTSCDLSEDLTAQPDDFDTDMHWKAPEFLPGSTVLIGDPEPGDELTVVEVELRNTYEANDTPLAAFAVTKQVVGPGGDDAGFARPERDFAVTFSCTLDGAPSPGYGPDGTDILAPDGTGVLRARVGEITTSPLFAQGTRCDLQEDLVAYYDDFIGPDHHWREGHLLPSGTVHLLDEDVLVEVVLRNYFDVDIPDPAPPRVTFEVTKATNGPEAGIVDPQRPFEVGFDCQVDDGPSSGTDSSGTVLLAPDGTGSLTVADGRTAQGPWFVPGTVCTLTEELEHRPGDFGDRDSDFEWTDAVFNRTMPIELTSGVSEPVGVLLTNVFATTEGPDRGVFAVTKRIEGPPGASLPADLTFTVDYTCTINGTPAVGLDPDRLDEVIAPWGTGTLTVAPHAPPTRGPAFDTGTVCELSEHLSERSGDFPEDGWSWQEATFAPGSVVTIDRTTPAEPIEITLTNTYAGPGTPGPGTPGPETPEAPETEGTPSAVPSPGQSWPIEGGSRAPDDGLAVTGGSQPAIWLLGGSLVVAGSLAVASRRRFGL
ncbi:choice-of-anchor A domain-containing protein [Salana multivorans]|uniref:Choice-of-anchor A domain-containing protein n=1 Tax=Salana multivorans TaxID=120377 RepID=A0A3N2DBL6_9MICO|nr:DUF5979 domain-containing protein [Salana multivorans]ROR97195.1 choice-of-anchor A domain-containing protein [Salana multivorans]